MNGKQQQPEIWVAVVGYEGLYEVSDYGNIRSFDRRIDAKILHNKTRVIKGRLLGYLTPIGYRAVDLYRPGSGRVKAFVHRLVLEAFTTPINGRAHCNHKNGNKSDNRLSNLEWCTPAENNRHAFETGLNHGPYGGMQGRSKLKQADVNAIRAEFDSGTPLSLIYGRYNVTNRHIRKIIAKTTWKYGQEKTT